MKVRKAGAPRISRHKKRHWRKEVDAIDVEDHLLHEFTQERFGQKLSEKSDKELFHVETKPDLESIKKPFTRARGVNLQELKCFSALQLNPLIQPAFVVKRGEGKTGKTWAKKFGRKTADAKLPTATKGERDAKAATIRSRLEERASELARRIKEPTRKLVRRLMQDRERKEEEKAQMAPAAYDIWSMPESHLSSKAGMTLDPVIEDYTMRHTKKKVPIAPKTLKHKTTDLPAIEVAHPGASYNPTFVEYTDLLEKAALIEYDKELRESKIDRRLAIPAGQSRVTQAEQLNELLSGLVPTGENDEEEEVASTEDREKVARGEEYFCPPGPVSTETRKLKAQRARERRAKAAETARLAEKEARRAHNEFFRLKSLKSQLKNREKEIEENAKRRKEEKIHKKFTTAGRHSKTKFEPLDLELALPSDLPASLRELKPEGDLFQDRFNSLQKRNKIETRVRQKRVIKHKRKAFTTSDHKKITVEYLPR